MTTVLSLAMTEDPLSVACCLLASDATPPISHIYIYIYILHGFLGPGTIPVRLPLVAKRGSSNIGLQLESRRFLSV
jgi:hypothetical protein